MDGFAIAGFDAAAREQGLTHPEALRDELRQRYGSLELDNKFPLTDGKLDLDLVRRAAAQKVEIVTWLAERFDPELLFVVFMAADHIHHLCWTDWEADGLASPVAEVYRVLDEAIGALAELAGEGATSWSSPTTVPARSTASSTSTPGWPPRASSPTRAGGGVAGRKLLGDALELRRYLPERLRYAAKQRLPALRDARDRARRLHRARLERDAGVLVRHLRQHRPQRPRPRGARHRGARRRSTSASATRSPRGCSSSAARTASGSSRGCTGARISSTAPSWPRSPTSWSSSTATPGWARATSRRGPSRSGTTIEIEGGSEHSYVGSHRHEGIVVLSGPAVAAGAPVGGELVDVAPTMLYLLGEPVPSDLEGRILVEALRPELLDARPPAYDDEAPAEFEPERAELEEEGAAEVERRLRGLGYLE